MIAAAIFLACSALGLALYFWIGGIVGLVLLAFNVLNGLVAVIRIYAGR